MQLPAQSANADEPHDAPPNAEITSRCDLLTKEIIDLKAVPSHNGHGSVGDGTEPAWYLKGLKIVRGFMEPQCVPPIDIIKESLAAQSPDGWRGVVFRLKGAKHPGIPYDSNWINWLPEAMEGARDPVVLRLSPDIRTRARSADQNIQIYLRWPGYAFNLLRTIQIYDAQDHLSITQLGLLSHIFMAMEELHREALKLDHNPDSLHGYGRNETFDRRCWQVAPLGPTAQREGRITLDCLWVIGILHHLEDVFFLDVMFAEEDCPPRFGRPYYSQHFMKAENQ